MTIKTKSRKNKHFILDQDRIKRAQKILGAKTETETIEIALERVIVEADSAPSFAHAGKKFLGSVTSGVPRDLSTNKDHLDGLGDD